MANVLKGTSTGAAIGATVGSVIPGIGNAVGTLAGAVYGTMVSVIGNIFGFGKAKKKIAALNYQAGSLMEAEAKQSKTLGYVIIAFVVAALIVLFVFLRKRK